MSRGVFCVISLILINVYLGFAFAAGQQTQQGLEDEAKKKISLFATQLKQALLLAIEQDGLPGAVNVCHQRAPDIADSLSTDGWRIARTSLKTRNENNQPDEWETQALRNFEAQHKAGAKFNNLTKSELGSAQFRYIEAIPTGQLCLACHGSAVDPTLKGAIDGLYPNDRAVNFALGDIRGAFTLTKDINH